MRDCDMLQPLKFWLLDLLNKDHQTHPRSNQTCTSIWNPILIRVIWLLQWLLLQLCRPFSWIIFPDFFSHSMGMWRRWWPGASQICRPDQQYGQISCDRLLCHPYYPASWILLLQLLLPLNQTWFWGWQPLRLRPSWMTRHCLPNGKPERKCRR